MKLTESEIRQVKAALGVDPVPEDHPAIPQLYENFGEHTFYADQDGLGFFMQRAREDVPPDHATFVLIAGWTDDTRSALTSMEPRVTETSLSLTGPGG